MNIVIRGRNRPERVDTSEFPVDVDTLEDGSFVFYTMTDCAELQLSIALGRDGAELSIVGLDDFMKVQVNEGPPFEGYDGNTEFMREVIIQLNDYMRENSCKRYQHTGEALLGLLRAVVLTAERALAKQIDLFHPT